MFEKLFGDKFNKFRLGQLLFITAISFGLFAGNIIRVAIAVLSLFCLTKQNFEFMPVTKEQKLTMSALFVFCVWIIIIPLIFGENTLSERLRSMALPLELILWIVAFFLFAKDSFFITNLKNFSIAACFVYGIITTIFCIRTSFAIGYNCWPFIHASRDLGAIMSALSAWVIYELLYAKSIVKQIFCFITFISSAVLVVLSLYTTYWVSFSAELIIALLLLLTDNRKKFIKFVTVLSVICAIVSCSMYKLSLIYPSVNNAITREANQLLGINDFNMVQFTNSRIDIWEATIKAIKEKPVFGHGLETFTKYSPNHGGRLFTQAHNTFLHAAFVAGIPFALLLIYLLAMFAYCAYRQNQTGRFILFFIPLLAVTDFSVASLSEAYLTDRIPFVVFWSLFLLTLIPTTCKNKITVSNQI